MRWLLPLLAGCTAQAGSVTVLGGGGGSSTPTYDYEWHGRAACGDTLHADADCFDDSSLDGSWAEWDVSSELTVTEGARGLTLTAVANAGQAGIYKPVVAGDVSYTIHGGTSVLWDAGASLGLGIADDVDAAPTTASIVRVILDTTGSTLADQQIELQSMTTHETFSGAHDDAVPVSDYDMSSVWLRVCIDDSSDGGGSDTYRACMSEDGRVWQCSATVAWASTQVTSPVDVAIVLTGPAAAVAYVDAFLVTESADCTTAVGSYDAP